MDSARWYPAESWPNPVGSHLMCFHLCYCYLLQQVLAHMCEPEHMTHQCFYYLVQVYGYIE